MLSVKGQRINVPVLPDHSMSDINPLGCFAVQRNVSPSPENSTKAGGVPHWML